MAGSTDSLAQPPRIHNYGIQLTAGIVPMITNLQYALKNFRREDKYALA
jgi:hypothetical protein